MSKPATTTASPDVAEASVSAARQPCAEVSPHRIEEEVRRCLAASPQLRIHSLVVRRIDQGICLQGVVDSPESTRDACSIARTVSGVDRVLNRLMVAPSAPARN